MNDRELLGEQELLSELEMPMRLGMIIEENLPMSAYFTGRSRYRNRDILSNAPPLYSKEDIKDYVNSYFLKYPDPFM